MIKFGDISNFIFLSRNANIYGFEVLKSLIQKKKLPSLVILPELEKKFFKKKLYLKKYFNLGKYNIEPIEYIAKKNSIPVKRIKTINSNKIYAFLKKKNLELIFIGGGWPELLKKNIFEIPKYLTINIHPSYLPHFRGGDVHRWQILYSRKKTGVSIHEVNKLFDNGKIIIKKSINLNTNCPMKLNLLLSKLVAKMIPALLKKKIKTIHNKKKLVKKHKYYSKWNWYDKKFFFVPSHKFKILEKFVNASKNIPNNFNGPFIRIGKKELLIRDCKIKNKNRNFFFRKKKKYCITRKNIILNTSVKNKVCFINKIQLLNDNQWNKNRITTKLITDNFDKFLI